MSTITFAQLAKILPDSRVSRNFYYTSGECPYAIRIVHEREAFDIYRTSEYMPPIVVDRNDFHILSISQTEYAGLKSQAKDINESFPSNIKITAHKDYLRSIVSGIRSEEIRQAAEKRIMDLEYGLTFRKGDGIIQDIAHNRNELIEYANSLDPQDANQFSMASDLYNSRIIAANLSFHAQLNGGRIPEYYVRAYKSMYPDQVESSDPLTNAWETRRGIQYKGPNFNPFPVGKFDSALSFMWLIAMKLYANKFKESLIIYKFENWYYFAQTNISVSEEYDQMGIFIDNKQKYVEFGRTLETLDNTRIIEFDEEIFLGVHELAEHVSVRFSHLWSEKYFDTMEEDDRCSLLKLI